MTPQDYINTMELALKLSNLTGASLRNCLAKAMAFNNIVQKMKTGEATFFYTKADGSLRIARGTLQNLEDKIKGDRRSSNPDVQVYYDLDVKDFRSFHKINIVHAQFSEWFPLEGC